MLWRREISLNLAGNRTPVVQLVARRYTDSAIPAPRIYSKLDTNGRKNLKGAQSPFEVRSEYKHRLKNGLREGKRAERELVQ
jgi:hypothetical protein